MPKTLSKRLRFSRVTSRVSAVPAGLSVQSMFDAIALEYDRFNAWASLGLHQRWRRALVRRIPSGVSVLDIATGTGDVAFLAAKAGHSVTGLDFSELMLACARAKDADGSIQWKAASADHLPYEEGSYGCVTSAFALRNLRSCLERVFRENFRVLSAGGKALHMDFGRPSGLLGLGHQFHMRYGIPMIGQALCGSRWPTGYLETTIQKFYEPSDVCKQLGAAGFHGVRYESLLGGVVHIYEGIKEC